ncbi:MAG: DEAD/DEAH box helicase [Mycobacteriales bacterium]
MTQHHTGNDARRAGTARNARGIPPGSRRRRPTPARRTASGPATPLAPRPSELERALDAAQAPAIPTDLPDTFAGLGMPDALVSILARRGMNAPFAIQARTLRDALAGHDILGRAQTGSGKTLAFGVPLLARLAADSTPARPGRNPRALVLVPTRELAQQVTDALAPLGQPLGLRLVAVYGGASMGRQIDALSRGTDVIVATPGRLIDLIGQGRARLRSVETSVIDEADFMADLGFLPAVTRLLDQTPPDGQRMLFSATLDRGVDKLAQRYLTEPRFHAVADASAPVETASHRFFSLAAEHKVPVVTELAGRPGRSLLFVRTKHGADRLAKQLRRAGVPAAAIHGNLSQSQRNRALDGFATGSARVLVATDVAARGLHVDDVDLVVHYDPAADHKDYLHRSGRTARAGASGTVVSLVLPEQVRDVSKMHALAHVSADPADVVPGHAAVVEIAGSGTPIAPVAGPSLVLPDRGPSRARPRRPVRRTTRAATSRG